MSSSRKTTPPLAQTAGELISEMIKAPTLDRFFDNDPSRFTDEDLMEYISIERKNRAMLIEKEG